MKEIINDINYTNIFLGYEPSNIEEMRLLHFSNKIKTIISKNSRFMDIRETYQLILKKYDERRNDKVIINLDLTGERFEIIYFLEGEFINLFFPYYPTPVVEFDVWGATLYLDKRWNVSHLFGENFDILKDSFSDEDDLYLAGRGHIKFEGVVSGSAHIAPYQSNKKDCAINFDQSIAEYRRSWPEAKFYTETYIEITAPSFYPPQSTEVELKCLNGKVTFTFDTDDIITVTELLTRRPDYRKYTLEKNLKKLEESYLKYPNLGE